MIRVETTTGVERVPLPIRAAAVMYITLGLGFGLGTAITLDHLRRHGELPMKSWGFRSFAGGPFEELSTKQFRALRSALVGVCALDVLAGAWLWRGQRRGLALGIVTTPLAFSLGVGFALPFPLAGVPMRVAFALAGRRDLG